MLLDLRGHYLDLLVKALEAGGNACLHLPDPVKDGKGVIYVAPSPKVTAPIYVAQYCFTDDTFLLQLERRSGGYPALNYVGLFAGDGLDKLWPELSRAMHGDKLAAPKAA